MNKPPQQLAIEKTAGPCLIMAGAGTGKTYTIVKKITHIISKNLHKPSEILCLTFSNEATNNLKNKVQEELKKTTDITIKTFHSFCADILKEYGEHLDIQPDFEILQPNDARVWFYKYLDVTPYYADLYVQTISTAKDFGISITQIEQHTAQLLAKLGEIEDLENHIKKITLELNTMHLLSTDTIEQRREIRTRKKEIKEFLLQYKEYKKYKDYITAWKRYEELKKEKNVQDFADLNYNVIQLLNKVDPEKIFEDYKYVIIDEFQDTNKLQFELIEHIAKDHRNITVVGDPNQSIYGFRGAYKEGFNHFKEVFEINDETDLFRLDKSYRSPNSVLFVAHKLIKNNYEDPSDCFLVENVEDIKGENVQVFELKNGDEEARKVAEIVEEEIKKGTPLNEICVLFRTHKQGKLLRQALDAKKIPTVTAGRTDLMQKPEIRTTIAYLSILNNLINRTGTGEQAWWDLFHYHNALTPKDSVKIGRYLKSLRDDNISIDQALLCSLDEIDISNAGIKIINRVHTKLNELMRYKNQALPELVLDIYEVVGLNRAFTHTRTIKNIEALMNLKQFYDIADNYYRTHDKNLSSFIDYLEILDKLGVEVEPSRIIDVNAIRVMTMHSVKGLEFKLVIVTNLAEKRFPLERTPREPLIPKTLNPDIKRHIDLLGELDGKEMEKAIKEYEKASLIFEERRLCYVSFTRAKENLILSYARSYNKEEDSSSPSIFLHETDFRENDLISVVKDDEEKCTIFAPSSMFEQYKSMLKKQLIESLDSEDFQTILSRLITYHAVREGDIPEYQRLVKWDKIIDDKEIKDQIKINLDKGSCLRFDPNKFTFSPTSLMIYDDCPKRYELSQIFRMPERGAFEWTGASTGSFIHQVLEDGVKGGFKRKEDFYSKAREYSVLPEWDGVDLDEINSLIDVFWERHDGKYDKDSIVENKLSFEIDGLRFGGKFDRIDFLKDKDVEIIDYKTNKNAISAKKRAWQLGFYALAAREVLGLNPVKLTLEMLRLDKPFEGVVDVEGNVAAGRSKGFNIFDVEKELIECARNIVLDYESVFLPVGDDNACRFCGYKFYCPKWG